MGKSQPDTHETVTRSEPPEYVVPYIKDALGEAQRLYESRGLYPDTGVPATTAEGFDLTREVARDPALIDPAIGYLGDALSGQYLDPDALRTAARAELSDVYRGVGSSFEGAGMTGSSLRDEAIGRGVTEALTRPYLAERQLQQGAVSAVPGLEQARYMPGSQLARIGQMERGIEERYYQEPWERLARYTGLALGSAPAQLAGGVQTTQQPIYQPSPFQQFLGAGLTLGGMFL